MITSLLQLKISVYNHLTLTMPNQKGPICCDVPMLRKIARQGRFEGKPFWLCPSCNKIIDATEGSISDEPAVPQVTIPEQISQQRFLPVQWEDIAHRGQWYSEYCCAGAIPGFLLDNITVDADIKRLLSQFIIFENRNRVRAGGDDHSVYSSEIITKLLQRGKAAPISLATEKHSLSSNKLLGKMKKSDDIEMGWKPKANHEVFNISKQSILSKFSERKDFVLEQEYQYSEQVSILFDSKLEEKFISEWVPITLGPETAQWFIPQAPLDSIIESTGAASQENRRVDFVFSHPCGDPFVVEIDGPEHNADKTVDQKRDEKLLSAGLKVYRVPNHEIEMGEGPILNEIYVAISNILERQLKSVKKNRVVDMIWECSYAVKLQFTIARSVKLGWLTKGGAWHITIHNPIPSTEVAILDLVKMFDALDTLYGESSLPCELRITEVSDKPVTSYWRKDNTNVWSKFKSKKKFDNVDNLSILLETDAGPFHKIDVSEVVDIIIRPACLPVEIPAQAPTSNQRRMITVSTALEAKESLTFFLNQIFRKKKFRDKQCDALFSVLKQQDTIVLLPTGAGKSLIYQLAGLLMPGLTMVVDPLTALIEDQIEGLNRNGIDRALGIASAIASPKDREKYYKLATRGEYFFVLNNPEQLQSEKMESFLRQFSHRSLINLTVIDEAHCVSEWGHNFRPAYLSVADNLKRLGKARDGTSPSLLGLTGTASRAVLRDMRAILGITDDNPSALIRPSSFDRPELKFDIIKVGNPEDSLSNILESMPDRFNQPRNGFFSSRDKDTQSGIVFTQRAQKFGNSIGILDLSKLVAEFCNTVGVYSTTTPSKDYPKNSWAVTVRTNAENFKSNHSVVLVATKAFGMGIDKPNIRYTVHYGMPQSLEAFYQEAGRAGRDGKEAHCIIIYTELDIQRSDVLLAPTLSLKDLREKHKQMKSYYNNDDVMTSIYFHVNGIQDQDKHIDDICSIIQNNQLGETFQVNIRDDKDADELAVYRLQTLGLVSSYTKDWNKKILKCKSVPYDRDNVISNIIKYVGATQPVREAAFKHRIHEVPHGKDKDEIKAFVSLLVEYVYEVIEASRRTMVTAAVDLARSSSNDQEIRDRLLRHLREGFGYEDIMHEVERGTTDFEVYWNIATKPQDQHDAFDLKGSCDQALIDSPNNPGVLLIRALAESRCNNPNNNNIQTDLFTIMSIATPKFNISVENIETIIKKIVDIGQENLSVALLCALIDYNKSEKDSFDNQTLDTKPYINALMNSGISSCELTSMAWQTQQYWNDLSSKIKDATQPLAALISENKV